MVSRPAAKWKHQVRSRGRWTLEADILLTAARRGRDKLATSDSTASGGAALGSRFADPVAPRDITNENIIQQLLSAQPPGRAERRGCIILTVVFKKAGKQGRYF